MSNFDKNNEWIFTIEQFMQMPTIQLSGYSFEEELLQRQLAAKFIADFSVQISLKYLLFKKYEYDFN